MATGGLSQKIHRLPKSALSDYASEQALWKPYQVLLEVITPPKTGPTAPAIARTTPIMELASGRRLQGISSQSQSMLVIHSYRDGANSGKQMMVIEYMMLPPTP